MNIRISPSLPSGSIRAIASKSVAHRVLICAAFADKKTKIRCDETNADIEATARCLSALGASIESEKPYFTVTPASNISTKAELRCGESGSTLRFMLPIVAALGAKSSFIMEGRLPERPLSPLYEELCANGAILSEQGKNPLVCDGKLSGNEFSIRGDVSSQFISGLLFASVLMGGGVKINIIGKTESSAYIDMTLDALADFGVRVESVEGGYFVPENCRLISPEEICVEGDWSNAAFPLCMGALCGDVSVTGLNPDSRQGDKKIVDILRRFGADLRYEKGIYRAVGGAELSGIDVDASEIPDLVPVITVIAAAAKGKTRIYGAARLRIKESDRLAAMADLMNRLGATVSETDDGLVIEGGRRLLGGEVSSFGDHRIAMSAGVASLFCDGDLTVLGAESVKKSYPDFWKDASSLGISFSEE